MEQETLSRSVTESILISGVASWSTKFADVITTSIVGNIGSDDPKSNITKTVATFYLFPVKAYEKIFGAGARPVHIRLFKGHYVDRTAWQEVKTWNQKTNPEGLKNMMIHLNKNQRLFIQGTGKREHSNGIRIQGVYFRGHGTVTVDFKPSLIPFSVVKSQLMKYNKWKNGFKLKIDRGTW